ncbi:hypothetical protein HOY80DRAFT_872528, partial [Tuber brumale]
QFPPQLASTPTFNSCQCLTLDPEVTDLHVPLVAHGQLYTGISSVQRRDHIRSFSNHDYKQGPASNIVYPDLLL